MMESPVSAFAIYKANQKPKRVRKNRKKKQAAAAQKELDNFHTDIQIQLARKLNNNQKKKEVKNIGKKKTHKKKREKFAKPTFHFENKRITRVSESEEVPILVKAAPAPIQEADSDIEEIRSLSSNNSIEFVPVQTDSSKEGLKVFKWMIAPYDPQEFLQLLGIQIRTQKQNNLC